MVFQVSWLVVQAIARQIARLPSSQIEVHTIIHVVCALLMYLFWWTKPQDVNCPIVVNSEHDNEILAEVLITVERSIFTREE